MLYWLGLSRHWGCNKTRGVHNHLKWWDLSLGGMTKIVNHQQPYPPTNNLVTIHMGDAVHIWPFRTFDAQRLRDVFQETVVTSRDHRDRPEEAWEDMPDKEELSAGQGWWDHFVVPKSQRLFGWGKASRFASVCFHGEQNDETCLTFKKRIAGKWKEFSQYQGLRWILFQ